MPEVCCDGSVIIVAVGRLLVIRLGEMSGERGWSYLRAVRCCVLPFQSQQTDHILICRDLHIASLPIARRERS